MNIEQWIDLFGKPADDQQIRDAVVEAGITKTLKIARNELGVRADIAGQGMTIVFSDETLLMPEAGLARRPILSSVMVVLDSDDKSNLYKSTLPKGLKKSDSQSIVRKKLGEPVESNEDNQTDAWLIDGLILAVSFTEDLKSIIQISVSLPNSH